MPDAPRQEDHLEGIDQHHQGSLPRQPRFLSTPYLLPAISPRVVLIIRSPVPLTVGQEAVGPGAELNRGKASWQG